MAQEEEKKQKVNDDTKDTAIITSKTSLMDLLRIVGFTKTEEIEEARKEGFTLEYWLDTKDDEIRLVLSDFNIKESKHQYKFINAIKRLVTI